MTSWEGVVWRLQRPALIIVERTFKGISENPLSTWRGTTYPADVVGLDSERIVGYSEVGPLAPALAGLLLPSRQTFTNSCR